MAVYTCVNMVASGRGWALVQLEVWMWWQGIGSGTAGSVDVAAGVRLWYSWKCGCGGRG